MTTALHICKNLYLNRVKLTQYSLHLKLGLIHAEQLCRSFTLWHYRGTCLSFVHYGISELHAMFILQERFCQCVVESWQLQKLIITRWKQTFIQKSSTVLYMQNFLLYST